VLRRLFQLLLLVLSVQLGGLADAFAYGAGLNDDEQGCCSDCPTEKSGLGCAPGCRLCHCHQAGVARLPELNRPLLLLPADQAGTEHCWNALAAPRQPFSSALYRPPRALTIPV
jgi:hypothetical protein